MKSSCPRLFEVEALRDGRLDGAQATRFHSHLALCEVCTRETRALQDLADALRSQKNVDLDQLHVRRERTRLLAAFDASLMPAPRSMAKLWLRWAAVAALLSTLTALAFVFWPARPASSPLPGATFTKPPEAVTVRADSNARWSRQVEAQLERITLVSGALSIRVDHGNSRRRLLVILPDGELEDIGTTFSVSADAGHTTRVTVEDGSVVLRLRGKPAIALGAGDSWSAPPPPAATAPESTPLPAPARPVGPATTSAVTPRQSASPRGRALHNLQPTPAGRPAARQSAPDPASAGFRAAMTAFDSGDHALAAASFATFLSQHPSDPRAEDAAYLRILALQRVGHAPAMKQAVQDYLSRYPRGFRRAEVETLSH